MNLSCVFDALLNEEVLSEIDAVEMLWRKSGNHHEQRVLLAGEECLESGLEIVLVLELEQVALLKTVSVFGESEVDIEWLTRVHQCLKASLVNPRRRLFLLLESASLFASLAPGEAEIN